MDAILWRDYVCPWCWLGRSVAPVLDELGVTVTTMPYELHPEFSTDGVPVRRGGRLEATLLAIGGRCAEVGLAFSAPPALPNSRRMLAFAELVRLRRPERFEALDDAWFEAIWARGRDLTTPGAAEAIVAEVGGLDDVAAWWDDPEGFDAVDASKAEANEHGIGATPTWLLDGAVGLPGVQDEATVRRMVERVANRRR
ncbi:MAG: DsbA family protein [Actinomycetota bacterium]|nr:DsbA family protein [Actinomycetota bacterium]